VNGSVGTTVGTKYPKQFRKITINQKFHKYIRHKQKDYYE